MAVPRTEQETVLRWDREAASLWTSDPRMMARMRRSGAKPTRTTQTTDGEEIGWYYALELDGWSLHPRRRRKVAPGTREAARRNIQAAQLARKKERS